MPITTFVFGAHLKGGGTACHGGCWAEAAAQRKAPGLVFGAHEWQRKLSRSCSVMEEEKRRAPAEEVAIWI